MRKKIFRKSLAVILAAAMTVSGTSIFPVSAEESAEILEINDEDVQTETVNMEAATDIPETAVESVVLETTEEIIAPETAIPQEEIIDSEPEENVVSEPEETVVSEQEETAVSGEEESELSVETDGLSIISVEEATLEDEEMLMAASVTSSYTPYAQIEYSYSSSVQRGTIRYISQVPTGSHFNSSYWPESTFGYYVSPKQECGTACISMALSYLGVNKTPNDILTANNGQTVYGDWGEATHESVSLTTAINNYLSGTGEYSPVVIHIPGYSTDGHFVVIVGKISDNTYQILDPWELSVTSMIINGTTATYTKGGSTITDTIDKVHQWRRSGSSGETGGTNNPIGCLDGAEGLVGSIHVAGWVYDADDLSASVDVHVYVGGAADSGAPGQAITANKSRSDVEVAYPGVGSNHGFDDYISTFGLTGTQTLYFYAINIGGGDNPLLGTLTVDIPTDTEAPVISNVTVSNVSESGYTVTCTVSDNVGVTKVSFPTWPSADDSGNPIWHEGTISGSTATCNIKRSDHGDKYGEYISHIYVYDAAGNYAATSTEVVKVEADIEAPVISNVTVSNVSASGYTVTCTVQDNVGIDQVMFPTWTSLNDQDDLFSSWTTNEQCKGDLSGNTVTYQVKTSDHNGETGLYITHISAYDTSGNSSLYEMEIEVEDQSLLSSAAKAVTWNGHTYYRFDSQKIWSRTKALCESLGGHLAVITSAEENEVVKALISDNIMTAYYLGGTDEEAEGTWKWVTGESFGYTNWDSGEPNNDSGEDYLVIYTSKNQTLGVWNDAGNGYSDIGYICEIDSTQTDSGISEQTEHTHTTELQNVLAATCTIDGYTGDQVCTVCGAVVSQGTSIPATGHSYVMITDAAATCGSTGLQHQECSICHAKNAQETIPATGLHTWSAWSTVSEATVFQAEEQSRSCSVCGAVEKQTAGTVLAAAVKLNVSGTIPAKLGQSFKVTVGGLTAGDSVSAYTSSNTKVATVKKSGEKDGTVTLTISVKKTKKMAGKSATITVTTAAGAKATFKVKAQTKDVATSKITVNQKTVKLEKGGKATIAAAVSPVTCKNKVTYKSSNTKIATVTSKGVIKGVKAGTAKITVKSGSNTVTVKVTVTAKTLTAISGVPLKKTLKKGKTLTLKPKFTPSGSEAKLTYSSSNKKVATVNSKGKITAKSKGTAVITVQAGSLTVKCKITVK